MSPWDLIGYLAAALVLAAFCMREMVPLRIAALCSNLAFIAYGLGLDLAPVWLLHALLLPTNCCRLLEALRSHRTALSSSRQCRYRRPEKCSSTSCGGATGKAPNARSTERCIRWIGVPSPGGRGPPWASGRPPSGGSRSLSDKTPRKLNRGL
jgi:hypothetical protein